MQNTSKYVIQCIPNVNIYFTLSIEINANCTYSSCIHKMHVFPYQNKTNPSERKRNFSCFSEFSLNLTANKICPHCTKHFFLMKYQEKCLHLNGQFILGKILIFPKVYSTFGSCKPYALIHSFAYTSVHKVYTRQYKIIDPCLPRPSKTMAC